MLTTTENAWVVGSDMDLPVVRSLLTNDPVLVEINGVRYGERQQCPMLVSHHWTVVFNEGDTLVLRYADQKLITLDLRPIEDGGNLATAVGPGPAVFKFAQHDITKGVGYFILQFPSHRIVAEEWRQLFPMQFTPKTVLANCREAVLHNLVETIKTFRHPGWTYNSICRFALMSNVHAKVLNAFRTEKWAAINAESDETICRIMRTMNWLPYLLAQSRPFDPLESVDETPCK